jgi:hypothetical protein
VGERREEGEGGREGGASSAYRAGRRADAAASRVDAGCVVKDLGISGGCVRACKQAAVKVEMERIEVGGRGRIKCDV